MGNSATDSDGFEDTAAASPVEVLTAVSELGTAAEQAAIVRLALSSGLLVRCVEPTAEAELARALKVPLAVMTDVCSVLVSLGALHRDGTRVHLTQAWAPLASGGVDLTLRRSLDGAAVRQHLLSSVFSNHDTYWKLDDGQRGALADAVTLATTTEFGRDAVMGAIAGVPELKQTLEAGARWLELGCGVAGMLLGTAHAFSRVTAVGIDIAPNLLKLAQERAEELGIADRVTFIHDDATSYTDDEPFDIVFWSQFFFPGDTRKATLANAFERLRPGGMLVCPILPGDQEPAETGSPIAQQAALNVLLFSGWGVPFRTGDTLAEEVDAAGFAEIRTYRESLPILMTARRPGQKAISRTPSTGKTVPETY